MFRRLYRNFFLPLKFSALKYVILSLFGTLPFRHRLSGKVASAHRLYSPSFVFSGSFGAVGQRCRTDVDFDSVIFSEMGYIVEKTGLVVEGGGMKCAYSAGILDKFLDDGITFDYVIGVSAGSANAASYLGGQRDRNKRFYTDHLHEKGYFGFSSFLKTGDLFGLDYIYSTLTNSDGADPLNWPGIEANPAQYEVVATNALTGKPHYFHKSQMHQDDYEIIKASCALPAACRPRRINGIPYYDGGVSNAIPADRAFKKGCDKAVVILSKPRGFIKKPEGMRFFYTIACHRYPRIVSLLNRRHIRYTRNFKLIFDLEKEGKVFVFAPSQQLPMSTYAMNARENQQLYNLGLQDYESQKEALQKFLQR